MCNMRKQGYTLQIRGTPPPPPRQDIIKYIFLISKHKNVRKVIVNWRINFLKWYIDTYNDNHCIWIRRSLWRILWIKELRMAYKNFVSSYLHKTFHSTSKYKSSRLLTIFVLIFKKCSGCIGLIIYKLSTNLRLTLMFTTHRFRTGGGGVAPPPPLFKNLFFILKIETKTIKIIFCSTPRFGAGGGGGTPPPPPPILKNVFLMQR